MNSCKRGCRVPKSGLPRYSRDRNKDLSPRTAIGAPIAVIIAADADGVDNNDEAAKMEESPFVRAGSSFSNSLASCSSFQSASTKAYPKFPSRTFQAEHLSLPVPANNRVVTDDHPLNKVAWCTSDDDCAVDDGIDGMFDAELLVMVLILQNRSKKI